MNIKITYLDTVPQVIPNRYPNQLLQSAITEFMKTDKPTMRIDVGDHYKNLKAARGAWVTAIRRSGYKLTAHMNADENCVYVIKTDPTGKEG